MAKDRDVLDEKTYARLMILIDRRCFSAYYIIKYVESICS